MLSNSLFDLLQKKNHELIRKDASLMLPIHFISLMSFFVADEILRILLLMFVALSFHFVFSLSSPSSLHFHFFNSAIAPPPCSCAAFAPPPGPCARSVRARATLHRGTHLFCALLRLRHQGFSNPCAYFRVGPGHFNF